MTERMQHTVDSSFEDVDAVIFMLSAQERIGAGDRFVAERVFALGVPVVIVLNKVDQQRPGSIAAQMKTAAALGNFHALHPISAKTGDGVADLRHDLIELLPEGVAYFPRDAITDMPLEHRLAELVREKALALTRDEVPHSLSVEVEEISERALRARILVETESQKQLLVGRAGRMVQAIGVAARPEVEQLLGHRIYLDLTVKVEPRWRRDPATLERLGI